MGEVNRAKDTKLGRDVALKVGAIVVCLTAVALWSSTLLSAQSLAGVARQEQARRESLTQLSRVFHERRLVQRWGAHDLRCAPGHDDTPRGHSRAGGAASRRASRRNGAAGVRRARTPVPSTGRMPRSGSVAFLFWGRRVAGTDFPGLRSATCRSRTRTAGDDPHSRSHSDCGYAATKCQQTDVTQSSLSLRTCAFESQSEAAPDPANPALSLSLPD